MIRHAESEFIADYVDRRQEFKENETKLSPEERERVYVDFAVQPKYVDSILTQKGYEQCK